LAAAPDPLFHEILSQCGSQDLMVANACGCLSLVVAGQVLLAAKHGGIAGIVQGMDEVPIGFA